jgi:dipeptidyl aminopeptidase/acylaminoacyl peptidase
LIPRAVILLGALLLALAIIWGCGKEETTESGKRLLAAGKYEEAILQFSKSIQKHPSDPDLHYSLGLAYSGAGRYEEAIKEFQVALSFAPDRKDIRYEMAKAAWKLGRRLVPLKTFIEILKSDATPDQEAEIKALAAEPHPVVQLTDIGSDNASPVFSPDGEKLAFVRVVKGRNVVVLMNLADKSERQITPKGFSDSNPSFTSDGNYLFVSSIPFPTGEEDLAELVRVNLVTGEREVVFRWERDIFKPTLSPDGGTVLFESYVDDNWEIFSLDLQTSKISRLTNNRSNDIDAEFSPDGLKILFASDRDGNFEIYEMNRDGSGQIRLTSDLGLDNMPCFSPDGKSIAFVTDRDGNEEIYLMDADGTNARRMTNYRGKDTTPFFSPDGKKLAFASTRGSSYLQINLMDMTREITRRELIEYLEYLARISWE